MWDCYYYWYLYTCMSNSLYTVSVKNKDTWYFSWLFSFYSTSIEKMQVTFQNMLWFSCEISTKKKIPLTWYSKKIQINASKIGAQCNKAVLLGTISNILGVHFAFQYYVGPPLDFMIASNRRFIDSTSGLVASGDIASHSRSKCILRSCLLLISFLRTFLLR